MGVLSAQIVVFFLSKPCALGIYQHGFIVAGRGDQIADFPLRTMASEIMREKLTLRLHQELPYQLTVETEKWEDRKDGSVRIDQIIYVARDGHKGIILGPNGSTIKSINIAARKEMEGFLKRKVHLFCQLKVRPNWLNEKARYTEMGLSFRDGDL